MILLSPFYRGGTETLNNFLEVTWLMILDLNPCFPTSAAVSRRKDYHDTRKTVHSTPYSKSPFLIVIPSSKQPIILNFPVLHLLLTSENAKGRKVARNLHLLKSMELLSAKSYNKHCTDTGWCGSVDWVLARTPNGHQFDSQSEHMPGFRARSPVGGMREATPPWCFSPFLSPSLPPFPSL